MPWRYDRSKALTAHKTQKNQGATMGIQDAISSLILNLCSYFFAPSLKADQALSNGAELVRIGWFCEELLHSKGFFGLHGGVVSSKNSCDLCCLPHQAPLLTPQTSSVNNTLSAGERTVKNSHFLGETSISNQRLVRGLPRVGPHLSFTKHHVNPIPKPQSSFPFIQLLVDESPAPNRLPLVEKTMSPITKMAHLGASFEIHCLMKCPMPDPSCHSGSIHNSVVCLSFNAITLCIAFCEML